MAGPHFFFTGRVNGIDYSTLLASVEISENQWFKGVFKDENIGTGRNACISASMKP
jgi:hypothetical protein